MKEIAIKQRFYPTTEQAELLAQTFGCVRVVYNAILKWRTDAFYNESQKVNYNAASSRLTELKKLPEFAWLNDVSCVPLQQSLRHQQFAFKNFFDGFSNPSTTTIYSYLYPLMNEDNIREVVAFPKNGSGVDVMMSSPSVVEDAQLKELRLDLIDE